MALVLAVEADPSSAMVLRQALSDSGHATALASDKAAVVDLLRTRNPRVVVIGRAEEFASASETQEWVQGLVSDRVGSIVLDHRPAQPRSAKAEHSTRWLPPPVSAPQIAVAVRQLLRLLNPSSLCDVYRFGDLELDDLTKRVACKGRGVHLSEREYNLLKLLLSSPGTVFDRQDIVRSVWGDGSQIDTRAVDVNVKRLRAALGGQLDKATIMTVRGRGYVLGPIRASGSQTDG